MKEKYTDQWYRIDLKIKCLIWMDCAIVLCEWFRSLPRKSSLKKKPVLVLDIEEIFSFSWQCFNAFPIAMKITPIVENGECFVMLWRIPVRMTWIWKHQPPLPWLIKCVRNKLMHRTWCDFIQCAWVHVCIVYLYNYRPPCCALNHIDWIVNNHVDILAYMYLSL